MMERYDLTSEAWTVCRAPSIGQYVRYDEAVAEINAAYDKGLAGAPNRRATLIEAAVQHEREEIVKELEEWLNDPNDPRPVAKMIGCIKAHGEKRSTPTCFTCGAPTDEESLAKYRGEKKPGKIDRLTYDHGSIEVMATRVNELIDAVNEMRQAEL